MRKKRGRPAIGITKKVSITLTEAEWAEIAASGLTIGAFLRERMRDMKDTNHFPRRYFEEYWKMYLRGSDVPGEATEEILHEAKEKLIRNLYRKDTDDLSIRTKVQFECPFTGKRYGSAEKLVRAAIPHLVQSVIAEKKRKAELEEVRKRNQEPKLWIDL